MKVYIDIMLIKSINGKDHVNDLDRVFFIRRIYKVKLKPKKCVVAITAEKFLGFIVNQ